MGNCQRFGEGEEEGKQKIFSRSGGAQAEETNILHSLAIKKRASFVVSRSILRCADSKELETAGLSQLGGISTAGALEGLEVV